MIAISFRILCSVLPSWSARGTCGELGKLRFLSLLILSTLTFFRFTALIAWMCEAGRQQRRTENPTRKTDDGQHTHHFHAILGRVPGQIDLSVLTPAHAVVELVLVDHSAVVGAAIGRPGFVGHDHFVGGIDDILHTRRDGLLACGRHIVVARAGGGVLCHGKGCLVVARMAEAR